jgi:hypothetical protein
MANNSLEDILGIAAGAILGYAILKAIFGDDVPCPNCRNPIGKDIKKCPHCGVWLDWS